MIEVFTVVGFVDGGGLESRFITPASWDIRRGNMRVCEYNKRTRTYSKVGQARAYQKRLTEAQPGGVVYRIAFLRIGDDGSLESGWVD